jgi:hypothetical protein
MTMKTKTVTTIILILALFVSLNTSIADDEPPGPTPEPPPGPDPTPTPTQPPSTHSPSTTSPPSPNELPIIVLPWTETEVYFGDEIGLDASESYDPDGQIVSFTWKHGRKVISEEATATFKPRLGISTLTIIIEDNDGDVVEQEVKVHCTTKPEPTTTPPPTTTAPPTTQPPVTFPPGHDIQGTALVVVLNCQAHVHADNGAGTVGLNDDGTLSEEIEGAYYTGSTSLPEILILPSRDGVTVSVRAYEDTTLDLSVLVADEGSLTTHVFKGEIAHGDTFTLSDDFTYGTFASDGSVLEEESGQQTTQDHVEKGVREEKAGSMSNVLAYMALLGLVVLVVAFVVKRME